METSEREGSRFDAPSTTTTTTTAEVPSVVAVVVTHDPGDRFGEALTSLAEQDYPSLTVLVVDAGSRDDPSPRIGAVLPDAYIRRRRPAPSDSGSPAQPGSSVLRRTDHRDRG
ncbi:MAG TPA: hypothetical protein VM618_03770 [Acidimicrobiia bacterium]|nr:hypothetical protein [Acidimicrobiia bacterium]